MTLVGPHRDDLHADPGPLPARRATPATASRGRSRSRCGWRRYDLLRATGDGAQPVLILDDVFAELDAGRRDRLAELVAGAEQVLVTAAVPQDVPAALDGARVDVMGGEVRRVR